MKKAVKLNVSCADETRVTIWKHMKKRGLMTRTATKPILTIRRLAMAKMFATKQ